MAYIRSSVSEESRYQFKADLKDTLRWDTSVHVDFLHFEGVIAACVFFWEKGRCLFLRTLPRM